ncbi:hypothetical protein J2W14_003230 [Pseudarthrobacter oxydans]|uniref:hypothetical protein n=1 Tax=Pseudarthrobacter oxydans TaxID=1671 RepID=UPI002786857B|nr:hypothetical protein [Pseudarthrobacter oxydans]
MTADDSANAGTPRRATPADAATVAQMLHEFNTEFQTPTPGVEELTSRLAQLLTGGDVVVLLIGEPAGGVDRNQRRRRGR